MGSESDELRQSLATRREHVGKAVWCESATAIESQRLHKRWQREVGVDLPDYDVIKAGFGES